MSIKIRKNRNGTTTITGLQDGTLRLLHLALTNPERLNDSVAGAVKRLAEGLRPTESYGEHVLTTEGDVDDLYSRVLVIDSQIN